MHSIVGTAAATTGTTAIITSNAPTTVKTRWVKNSHNTWSYKGNGVKKTGWLKDNDSWY